MPEAAELFSLVVPCHNHARFLPEALASLEAQEAPGLEVILVNDGSLDETSKVAAELAAGSRNLKIRLLEQENLGPAAARNNGIALAGREWILTLDSDDVLAAGFLHAAAAAIDAHPEINALTGAYREFGARQSGWRLTRFRPEKLLERGNILNCSPFKKVSGKASAASIPATLGELKTGTSGSSAWARA